MKTDRLAANSDVYNLKSDSYELFSQAEDAPNKAGAFLLPYLKDKIVLDFGCGTGKFIPLFAPTTKQYITTDISETQLAIAKKKAENFDTVTVLKIENNKLPLEDSSVDVIFSAWVIGSIQDLNIREAAIEEFKRVLKPGGKVFLIENNVGGEYKEIVDGEVGNERTRKKLVWLENHNFWQAKVFETEFVFNDTETAQSVFSEIWDEETASAITKNTIAHNVVILEYEPNRVLDSTKYVVEHAQYVHINQDKLKEFVDGFTIQSDSNWLADSPFPMQDLPDEQKLMVVVVFNALSFSYWGEPYWNVEYKGILHTRGSWSLMAAIFRSIEEGNSLLEPAVLENMTKEKLLHILRGNTEIPLIEERVKILNTVGVILMQKYGGRFSNVLKVAEGNALKLVDMILTEFSPSFDDWYGYKGKEVFFNKRAQALVESIHSLFNAEGLRKFEHIDSLTALADYIIPNLLRHLGIIEYTSDLSEKIDAKESLEKGSEYEIEIRASVVWAVEYMTRELFKKGMVVSSKAINDYLWLAGGTVETPFHRTRTTAY
jgi:ubiquinone/menaquinone biosynthesis C-methylase UbiE